MMEQTYNELKAVAVILRASQAIQDVIRKDAALYGLNPTEFAVLELLHDKGDQTIQVIGKKILISSGSITYVVDKLEQKGYAVRRRCPKDRRVTYAATTQKGKVLMDEIFPKHKLKMGKVFDGLQPDEFHTAIDLIKRIGCRAGSL